MIVSCLIVNSTIGEFYVPFNVSFDFVFMSQISGSLARRAIRELMAIGLIRMVSAHSSQQIYTRATNT